MRSLALALVLIAGTGAAAAQSGEFQTAVTAVAEEFERALAAEQVVPFVQPQEHPAVQQAAADALGMTVMEYRSRARSGYSAITAASELLSHRLVVQNTRFGSGAGIEWALLPYELQIALQGQSHPPPRCNRLLVFRSEGQIYLAVIATDRSAETVAAAMPALAAAMYGPQPGC